MFFQHGAMMLEDTKTTAMKSKNIQKISKRIYKKHHSEKQRQQKCTYLLCI